MWFKKTVGVLATFMLLLAACQPSPSASPTETGSESPSVEPPPQVLHVNLIGEPASLDPNLATDSGSIQVLRSVTHTLVAFDESLNLVPGLAATWETSADGKTITFTLADGIAYSDGQPIVAGDFVYGWRRLSSPVTASEYAYVLEPVVGFPELNGADPAVDDIAALSEALGVSAPDDKTFVVELSVPATYFAYVASMWLTAPLREDMVFTEAEGYISSGPLSIESWNHSSSIVLVPNEHWAGRPVTVERVEMAMIVDRAAELAAYEADTLDIGRVPNAEVARVEDDPELSQEIRRGERLSLEYFGFDMLDPDGPFARSTLLRVAFHEAIDKETVINVVQAGIGQPATGIVPPGMPGHQDKVFIPFDIDQARADFDAALDELGMTAADLQLEIGFNNDGDHEAKIAFMQQAWKDAFDIDVTPVSLEFSAYLDQLSEDPYDIFRLGWGADFPHPRNFLYDLTGCNSGNNNVGYCSEEADALMAQADITADAAEQVALYNQAEDIIMSESPLLTLSYGSRFTLVKPWVQGLVATAQDSNTGETSYAWVTIAPH